jgi:murein DD-endopeptidase MepM/ murein hydrolase activator NlpD
MLLALFALAAPAEAAGTGGGSGGATAGAGASARTTGGASADSASGGPLHVGALPYGAPVQQRPVARIFTVTPRSVREGTRPRIRLRIVHQGIDRVSARIVAVTARTGRVAARFDLGTVRTGRTLVRTWPRAQLPRPGRYVVRLHVRDPYGATLARVRAATGKAQLTVRRRPRPARPQPAPAPAPQPAPQPPAGVGAGVFPVAGPWTWSGEDGRFGAARKSHRHEGQDILAAEGTPVVSPLPGTVAFVDHQAGGAGWYVVIDADDGRSMFFAHCQADSIPVQRGQRVAAGQQVCRVGQTGSATGPHLHFELWEGGWRDRGGRPVDPRPQLEAWATG